MRVGLALVCLLSVGCGSSTDASNGRRDAVGTDGATADGPMPSPTADASEADAAPAMRTCRRTCRTAAECAYPGMVPTHDADNWACTNWLCEYLGCNSDAECISALIGGACRRSPGAERPSCQATCTSAAGCVRDDGAYAARNFGCEDGVCRWHGCQSDDECQRSLGGEADPHRFACRALGSDGFRTCEMTCQGPADCSTGAATTDTDNYVCEAGLCRYLGCLTDDECRATVVGRGEQVCR